MVFALLPTPRGEYYVAAERVSWFCSESLERSLIWMDDGTQHTVLLAVADLATLLGYSPPAQVTTHA